MLWCGASAALWRCRVKCGVWFNSVSCVAVFHHDFVFLPRTVVSDCTSFLLSAIVPIFVNIGFRLLHIVVLPPRPNSEATLCENNSNMYTVPSRPRWAGHAACQLQYHATLLTVTLATVCVRDLSFNDMTTMPEDCFTGLGNLRAL